VGRFTISKGEVIERKYVSRILNDAGGEMAKKLDPKIVEAARNRSSHSERGETQKYTIQKAIEHSKRGINWY